MRQDGDRLVSREERSKSGLWFPFLLPAIPVVLIALSVWSDLRQFNEKSPFLATGGVVAKVECANHGRYQVSFTVGEQIFTRESGNSTCTQTVEISELVNP